MQIALIVQRDTRVLASTGKEYTCVHPAPNLTLKRPRAVLRSCGNMSAVTVMFVLERSLAEEENKKVRRRLLSSLGPGFTAGFLLLEES